MLWLALWWCVSLDPVAEMDVIRQGRAESTGGCDWGGKEPWCEVPVHE